MDNETFFTKSEDETIELGKNFAKDINPGDTIAFFGDLGAGKTELIKGICSYFKINEIVTSPTFTIMNKYTGYSDDMEFPIFHIDLYRIKDTKELDEIGFQDCIYAPNAIKLIEWAEKAEEQMTNVNYTISISFSDDEDDNNRTIKITKIK